ncbi:hypothetical protein QQS21_004773 [Conoideocrella luteorostrata]|uniref:FAD/NAD(P)-binding domain-containing protein n=1 Tax=Conoideocrella luteorostrata TaxID=1105319 RepID=A0AAJ0CQR2_9HYPO|nr:hypothetical protein QQS21_004773 [Conoideocrella luteorostrata]
MSLQSFKFIYLYARFVIPRLFQVISEKIHGFLHRLTYRAVDSAQNVVVLGGSFGGIALTQRLARTLPTGYRVILVEKNSHFNYLFNFPRYSVLQRREHLAFIPYDGIASGAPAGIYQLVRGEVTSITDHAVLLTSGGEIPYAYLCVATGTSQTPPAKLRATSDTEGCAELQTIQAQVKASQKIAVIGAGAVGVELATDIKSYYPEKDVTLIHSRERLLSRFGSKLHDHALAMLEKLSIEVLLNQRPEIPTASERWLAGRRSIQLADGQAVEYDLIIPCTGQVPNSQILESLRPDAISYSTGRILVQPTLQISSVDKGLQKIFALGDVAETAGPKMARAAWFQADVVHENILAMTRGKRPTKIYAPNLELEGALKLTVGKSDWLLYTQSNNGDEMITSGSNGKEDLDVESVWAFYNADFRSAVQRNLP